MRTHRQDVTIDPGTWINGSRSSRTGRTAVPTHRHDRSATNRRPIQATPAHRGIDGHRAPGFDRHRFAASTNQAVVETPHRPTTEREQPP